ncbi:MAG: pilus assembly protein [Chloroflexi bacterium]|nr:pilus assembly protein [Chloroflexota bacterium]
MTRSRRAGRPRGQRGQSLVEFALVFPLFLLLLFGIVDGARTVFAWNGASQAARDVARVAAVNCLGGATPCTSGAIAAAQAVQAVQLPGGGTWAIACLDPGTLATVSGRPCKAGDLVSVSASTSISMLTPVVGQLVGPLTLTAVSRMEIVQ